MAAPHKRDLQKNNTARIFLAFDEIPIEPRKRWQNPDLMTG
jgi:hypothetical protein